MPKKPENLLNELESISSLLNDSEDNIPILQETIEDVSPQRSTLNTDELNSGVSNVKLNTQENNSPQESTLAPGNYKSKQIIKPQATLNTSSASRKKGDGDNPFLPQHIRTRLKEGKESFMKEQLSQPGNPYEPIIDELVAYYLPIIEKDLREKLKIMATSFASTPYDEIDIDKL